MPWVFARILQGLFSRTIFLYNKKHFPALGKAIIIRIVEVGVTDGVSLCQVKGLMSHPCPVSV